MLGCLCGKAGTSHLCDGSTHSSGCVVNGYGCLFLLSEMLNCIEYLLYCYDLLPLMQREGAASFSMRKYTMRSGDLIIIPIGYFIFICDKDVPVEYSYKTLVITLTSITYSCAPL